MGKIQTLILLFFFAALTGQEEWKLKKKQEDILLFTRGLDSFKYDEYKVEADLNANMHQIVSIFKDFSIYSRLFPDSKNIELIDIQEMSHIFSLEVATPFFSKDRFGVYKNDFSFNKETKQLHIEISCLNTKPPKKTVMIQIVTCAGSWDFYQKSDSLIHVIHRFVGDPGGFAPAFFVNKSAAKIPIRIIMEFKELLKDPKYNHQHFDFIPAGIN